MAVRLLSSPLSLTVVVCFSGAITITSGPARAAPDALSCATNYWAFALMNPAKAQAGQERARHLIKGHVDQNAGQSYESVAKGVDSKGRELAANIQYLKTEAARLAYDIQIKPGSKAEKKALADQEYAKRKTYLDREQSLMSDLAACEKAYFQPPP